MVIGKIFVLLATVFGFFGSMVFGPGYSNLEVQAFILLLLLLLNTVKHGLQDTKTIIAFCIPFVLSLLAFGFVFDWLELMGRMNWFVDSLLKSLVFPNSLLIVKLAVGCISFRDILLIPLPASIRRNVIVTKAVMDKSGGLLTRHRFFMDTTPHFADLSATRRQIYALCGTIMATYISIYRQTEKTQELFDHRTAFLRNRS